MYILFALMLAAHYTGFHTLDTFWLCVNWALLIINEIVEAMPWDTVY